MFKTILVAVDGSDHATRALDAACDLAQRYDARLIVLSVYRHHSALETTHTLVAGQDEIEPPDKTLGRLARDIVDAALARARQRDAAEVEGSVRRGPPARTIVEAAKECGADVIVLGSRGLGDVGGFLLGSVSHKVSSLAECTCIIVK